MSTCQAAPTWPVRATGAWAWQWRQRGGKKKSKINAIRLHTLPQILCRIPDLDDICIRKILLKESRGERTLSQITQLDVPKCPWCVTALVPTWVLPHPEDLGARTAWLHLQVRPPSARPQPGWPQFHSKRGSPRPPGEDATGNGAEEDPKPEGRNRRGERGAEKRLRDTGQSNHTVLLEPALQAPQRARGCVPTCNSRGGHSEELRERGKRKQLALYRFHPHPTPGGVPGRPVDSKKRRNY